jgi:hypothetical protein
LPGSHSNKMGNRVIGRILTDPFCWIIGHRRFEKAKTLLKSPFLFSRMVVFTDTSSIRFSHLHGSIACII